MDTEDLALWVCALLVVVWLTGCATTVREPVEVKVPVPVPCVSEIPQAPVFAFSQAKFGQPLDEHVALLLADRRQRIGYEAALLGLLEACR